MLYAACTDGFLNKKIRFSFWDYLQETTILKRNYLWDLVTKDEYGDENEYKKEASATL